MFPLEQLAQVRVIRNEKTDEGERDGHVQQV